ncbi:CFEM domain-containing protein [Zalerion maritima]|uniref:CFEM domain-containing protein n=1 Tax=Zalerion maritima TaxID=339359 RepID=A0AAD5WPD9_9PEZI|nr:CFEM domain-containing protein [Zalerion maritima]
MFWRWQLVPFLALSLFATIAQAVNPAIWASMYTEFPQCGVECAAELVPSSNCKSLSNYTCLCEDVPIRKIMTECVYERCNGMETFKLAKLNAEGCETPVRSRRGTLLGLIPVEVIVITSFFLRFFSRKTMVGKYDRDDHIMLAVFFLYFLFVAIGNLAYFRGFGVDIWTVEEHKVDVALRVWHLTNEHSPYQAGTKTANSSLTLKLFFFSNTLYLLIMELTKTSILMFYLRVFPHDNFRLATFVTITWVALCALLFMALQMFQCLPIQFNWLGWRGDFDGHRCININMFAYTVGATMILQDVVILLLPLPWLISLNTSVRNRIGIIVMFSMGVFILITSCIRTRYLVTYARTVNPTWDYTDQLVWSALEVAVSILVVNIPAMRVLFVKKISPAVRCAFSGTHHNDGIKELKSAYYHSKTTASSIPRTHVSPHHRRSNSNSSKLSKNETSLSIVVCEAAPPSLDLGDKLKGDVHTMICAGAPMGSTDGLQRSSATSSRLVRGQSNASDISLASRILVETTTTRVVAPGEPSDSSPVRGSTPPGARNCSPNGRDGSFSFWEGGKIGGPSFGSLGV